jgi:hypothetical protein
MAPGAPAIRVPNTDLQGSRCPLKWIVSGPSVYDDFHGTSRRPGWRIFRPGDTRLPNADAWWQVNGEFCSLTGARTLIDSNLVELHCLDVPRLSAQVRGENPSGVEAGKLCDVLHEAVHHWCFDTPVGAGLGLLREQLVEEVLKGGSLQDFASLYIRYVAAAEAIRPIVEGIALFAEFDVLPGDGNLRVVPLFWLAMLAEPSATFVGGGIRVSEDVIFSAIKKMRLLDSTLDRKDGLLCQPLGPHRSGGYLTGYLLVKGLWQRLKAGNPLARDPELWLAFIRAWCFNDTEFARALVMPTSSDSTVSDECKAADRFLSRVEFLTEPVAAAEALIEFNTTVGKAAEGAYSALGLSSESVSECGSALRVHLDRLDQQSDSLMINSVRGLTGLTIDNRGWICVGSESGQLHAPNPGTLLFDGATGTRMIIPPMPASAPRRGAPVGTGEEIAAALEYWIAPLGEGAVSVLASERGAHWHNSVWTGDTQSLEDFLSRMRSNGGLIEAHDWILGFIDQFIAGQPIGPTVKGAVDLYLDTALTGQAHLAVELFGGGSDAVARLWEDGFSTVLGTPYLRRQAGRMSLRLSLGDREVREIDPTDRSNRVREVTQAGNRCGLTLANMDEQRLLL